MYLSHLGNPPKCSLIDSVKRVFTLKKSRAQDKLAKGKKNSAFHPPYLLPDDIQPRFHTNLTSVPPKQPHIAKPKIPDLPCFSAHSNCSHGPYYRPCVFWMIIKKNYPWRRAGCRSGVDRQSDGIEQVARGVPWFVSYSELSALSNQGRQVLVADRAPLRHRLGKSCKLCIGLGRRERVSIECGCIRGLS
jgi:hypothetical protein